MRKYIFAFTIVLFAFSAIAQVAEINVNTDILTPHWKNLPRNPVPVLLKGKYYFKLDNNGFVATDGTN